MDSSGPDHIRHQTLPIGLGVAARPALPMSLLDEPGAVSMVLGPWPRALGRLDAGQGVWALQVKPVGARGQRRTTAKLTVDGFDDFRFAVATTEAR